MIKSPPQTTVTTAASSQWVNEQTFGKNTVIIFVGDQNSKLELKLPIQSILCVTQSYE